MDHAPAVLLNCFRESRSRGFYAARAATNLHRITRACHQREWNQTRSRIRNAYRMSESTVRAQAAKRSRFVAPRFRFGNDSVLCTGLFQLETHSDRSNFPRFSFFGFSASFIANKSPHKVAFRQNLVDTMRSLIGPGRAQTGISEDDSPESNALPEKKSLQVRR